MNRASEIQSGTFAFISIRRICWEFIFAVFFVLIYCWIPGLETQASKIPLKLTFRAFYSLSKAQRPGTSIAHRTIPAQSRADPQEPGAFVSPR